MAAAALAIVYLAAAWFMLSTFALHDPPQGANYDRAVAIFAGIQSIGYTAIGVLLGAAVQQPLVAAARSGEVQAKQAITDVIAPSSELGGASLPDPIVKRLKEGLR
jgi:hypothetical protein